MRILKKYKCEPVLLHLGSHKQDKSIATVYYENNSPTSARYLEEYHILRLIRLFFG